MKRCPHCMKETGSAMVCSACGKFLEVQSATHQLQVGAVLTDGAFRSYEIGAVLGQGGFGITYIAYDLRRRIRVAIKEYYPLQCAQRSGMQVTPTPGAEKNFAGGQNNFLKEAQLLASLPPLDHVVQILDYFEANGTAYLVMEYLDGTPLHRLAAQHGTIPAAHLFSRLPTLLEDFQILHNAGVIHRDISPDNILWMPDGSLKLLDFGSARHLEDGKSVSIQLKHGFAPVEQYRTRGQGSFTDVYALCATIYYCITGNVPPHSVERLETDQLQPPSAMGISIDPVFEEALLWGLTVQPQARPQDMNTLRQRMFANGYPPILPFPEPAPQPEPVSEPVPDPKPDVHGETVIDAGGGTTHSDPLKKLREVFGTLTAKLRGLSKPVKLAAGGGILVLLLVVILLTVLPGRSSDGIWPHGPVVQLVDPVQYGYTKGQRVEGGLLEGLWISSPHGHIYGITTEGNAVLLDGGSIPNPMTIPETVSEANYPVTHIDSSFFTTMRLAENSDQQFTLSSNVLLPRNVESWIGLSDRFSYTMGTLAADWYLTAAITYHVNQIRVELGYPEATPILELSRLAQQGAAELQTNRDAETRNGRPYHSILNENQFAYTAATEQLAILYTEDQLLQWLYDIFVLLTFPDPDTGMLPTRIGIGSHCGELGSGEEAVCVFGTTEDSTAYLPAEFEENGLRFEIQRAEAVVTACDPSLEDVVIPDEIHGFPVTTVAAGAFDGCDDILALTLGNNITLLEEDTLSDCSHLFWIISNAPDLSICCEDDLSGCPYLLAIQVGPRSDWLGYVPLQATYTYTNMSTPVGDLTQFGIFDQGYYGLTTQGDAVVLNVFQSTVELDLSAGINGHDIVYLAEGSLDYVPNLNRIYSSERLCYDYSLHDFISRISYVTHAATRAHCWQLTCETAALYSDSHGSTVEPSLEFLEITMNAAEDWGRSGTNEPDTDEVWEEIPNRQARIWWAHDPKNDLYIRASNIQEELEEYKETEDEAFTEFAVGMSIVNGEAYQLWLFAN